jgi:hypothetical protein
VRAVILSASLFVVNVAFNISLAKGWAESVPNWLVILLWIVPVVPLVWWAITHDKLARQKLWIRERFSVKPWSSALAAVAVLLVVALSLAGAGYRIRAGITKHPVISAAQTSSPSQENGKAKEESAPQSKGNSPPSATPPIKPKRSHRPVLAPNTSAGEGQEKPTPQTPPIESISQGAGSALSINQQGGVTAAQVTIGARTWNMSREQQSDMIEILKTAHGSIRIEWITFDQDSLKFSSGIRYVFVNAGWILSDRPNGAGIMCYPSNEWDCQGLQLMVRDKTSNLTNVVLKALSILHTSINVLELSNDNPDDLVVITVAKP